MQQVKSTQMQASMCAFRIAEYVQSWAETAKKQRLFFIKLKFGSNIYRSCEMFLAGCGILEIINSSRKQVRKTYFVKISSRAVLLVTYKYHQSI